MAAIAIGGPTTKRVGRFSAPANKERLKTVWGKVSEASRGPNLLYVVGVQSKCSAKIDREIFTNASIVLAARLCRPIRVTPDQAVELECLKEMPRISDPMLVAVGRDGKVRGHLAKMRKLTVKHCYDLMAKAVDHIRLGSFVGRYLTIVEKTERLWKEDRKLARQLAKKPDAELEKRRSEIRQALADLVHQETVLRSSIGGEGPAADEEDLGGASLTAREREAIRAYRKQAQTKNPVARARALHALATLDSPAVARVLLDAARTGSSWTVWQAADVLSRMRSRESVRAILRSIRQGRGRERVAALLALSKASHPSVSEAVLAHAGNGGETLRLACVRAMASQRDERTASALLSAPEDRSPAVRVVAARAVGKRHLAGSTPALIELLGDRDWSVRLAAMEAMGRLNDGAAVPHLLDCLAREEGRLKEASHDALVALTAKTFLFDVERWGAWWEASRFTFEPASAPEVEAAQENVSALLRKRRWPGAFVHHSILSFSRRVVFAIDVSQSMGLRMNLPPGVSEEVREKLWSGSKLDLARKELVATLKSLDRNVEFNIVAFAGGAETWRRKLSRASHRGAAIHFLDKLKVVEPSTRATPTAGRAAASSVPSDVTVVRTGGLAGLVPPPGREHERNLYGALLTALDVLDPEPLAVRSRPAADTVFLVVDGPPEQGEVREVSVLAEIATEVNLTRGIVIHVVTFSSAVRRLLAPLAETAGGKSVVHGG
jgi:hypothetical protein